MIIKDFLKNPKILKLEFKFTVWRNWLTVGGIRSTGATACMGIASHVLGLINKKMESKNETTLQSNDLKEWNMHTAQLTLNFKSVDIQGGPKKSLWCVNNSLRVWANHDKGLWF